MQVRAVLPAEHEAARVLLVSNGWNGRCVADPQAVRLLVERSRCSLVAVVAGQVVGFFRALTDGLSNGRISMVVVAQAHRRQGVGSALVGAVMGDDPEITWALRAGRTGVAGFYEKLGFRQSRVAMERPLAKPPAG